MKVWRIRIIEKAKATTIRDVADKTETYYANFKYTKGKKGNWSMSHDYQQERFYSGIATTIQRAMDLALKCAKKDGFKNPEVIEIARYGTCNFGLKLKSKSPNKKTNRKK